MSGMSCLVRRGGTLYFRARVPADLRQRLGRAEIRTSLGTGRILEAKSKVFALARLSNRVVNALKAGLGDAELAQMEFDKDESACSRLGCRLFSNSSLESPCWVFKTDF